MVDRTVFYIKLIHAIILVVVSLCLLYILYSSIAGYYHWTVFLAIGLVVEGAVLIFYGWRCPLTALAKKYGDEIGRVTDIFFPAWFVPHVFTTYAVLFAIGIPLLIINYFV